MVKFLEAVNCSEVGAIESLGGVNAVHGQSGSVSHRVRLRAEFLIKSEASNFITDCYIFNDYLFNYHFIDYYLIVAFREGG